NMLLIVVSSSIVRVCFFFFFFFQAEDGIRDFHVTGVQTCALPISGFQYGFEFDENQAEDDMAVNTDGVTLLVDPLSLQYLMGAEVDYSEGLSGAQFVIRNPNAKTTCGCGSSFSV